MTPASCSLCDGTEVRRLFESGDRIHHIGGNFHVYRCLRCEAIFYRPGLEDRELEGFYPESYGRFRRPTPGKEKSYQGIRRFVLRYRYNYPGADGERFLRVKKMIAFPLSWVTAKGVIPYRGEGRLLDMGCGNGSFLYRAKRWGWEVYGVEPSSSGAAHAKELGLRVFQGRLQDSGFPEGYFDVVRMNHVLEHLTDPKGTLLEIRRILKPGGLIYVTVPNTRSLTFWMFRENWYALDVPRHVVSYCPKAMKHLSDAAGLKVLKLKFRSGPFCFVRSMRYWVDARENGLSGWFRRVDWVRNRSIRRALKPLFFILDLMRVGDIMQVTLEKPVSQRKSH